MLEVKIGTSWKKAIIYLLSAIATAVAIGFGLSSCNVARVIENKSEFYQRGDTCVQITTKTTETYNAIKN